MEILCILHNVIALRETADETNISYIEDTYIMCLFLCHNHNIWWLEYKEVFTMAFRQGSFASVWQVEQGKGKSTRVRLSTSRKNKQTDQYEQDFSGYCLFIGDAHARAALLKERDRIKLGEIEVTNRYDKESGRTYVDYKVFSFDMAEAVGGKSAGAPAAANRVEENPVESDDESLPF